MPCVAQGASLVTLSGHTFTGSPVMSGAGITVDGHTIPFSRLVCFQTNSHIPLFIQHGVLLSNGSLLRGVVSGMTPAAFTFQSDLFSTMTIPAANLRGVLYFTNVTAIHQLAHSGPAAILKNGTHLNGKVVWMDASAVGFEYSSSILKIANDRLQCLIFHPPSPIESAKTRTLIRLKNGDLWVVHSLTITATSLVAQSRRIPWAAVAAIWTQGPDVMPITMVPRILNGAIKHNAGALDVNFHAPIYFNRLRNRFLSVHGQYFESGIACRPGAILEYKTGSEWKIFVAAVGVRGHLPVNIKVVGDGKVLLRRLVNPGRPQWIRVLLRGAKVLQLQTLPGSANLLTPRVIWGDAFVIK